MPVRCPLGTSQPTSLAPTQLSQCLPLLCPFPLVYDAGTPAISSLCLGCGIGTHGSISTACSVCSVPGACPGLLSLPLPSLSSSGGNSSQALGRLGAALAALPPPATGTPASAAALPSWVSTPLCVWAAAAAVVLGVLAAATRCRSPLAAAALASVDILTQPAIFWVVRAQQAQWRRPLLASAPFGGACTLLLLATVLTLALALLLRRTTDNTLSTEGLSIFRRSTWALASGARWAQSPLPALLPSGLTLSFTAVGEAGACASPLNWSATAPAHGSGAWRLVAPAQGSQQAAGAAAQLAPQSFSFQCAACGLGWSDSLALTLPYSCQGLVLEVGAVGADGTLWSASAPLPPPPPGSLLTSLAWTLSPMLHLLNDTRSSGGSGAAITLGYMVGDSPPVPAYTALTPAPQGGLGILPNAATISIAVAFPLDRSLFTTTLSDRVTVVELLTSWLSLGSLVGVFITLHTLALHCSSGYRQWVKGGSSRQLVGGGGEREGRSEGEEEEEEEEEGEGEMGGVRGRGSSTLTHRKSRGAQESTMTFTNNPLNHSLLHARGERVGWVGAGEDRGEESAVGGGAFAPRAAAREEESLVVNPLHAATAATAAHAASAASTAASTADTGGTPEPSAFAPPALVPGWSRAVSPSTGGEIFEEGEGSLLQGLPEGVDALERFECLEGRRYYWSDGRRGPKGKRDARLLAPGWRRCVRDGEVWFWHPSRERLVRRPDFVF